MAIDSPLPLQIIHLRLKIAMSDVNFHFRRLIPPLPGLTLARSGSVAKQYSRKTMLIHDTSDDGAMGDFKMQTIRRGQYRRGSSVSLTA